MQRRTRLTVLAGVAGILATGVIVYFFLGDAFRQAPPGPEVQPARQGRIDPRKEPLPPGERQQWSLTLEPDVTDIVPGEPLHLIARLRNISDRPLKFSLIERQSLCYYRSESGGRFSICAANRPGNSGELRNVLLQPGQSFLCDEVLYYLFANLPAEGKKGLVFPTPGDYRIKASMEAWGKEVESPPVAIIVRKPADVDREAVLLLANPALRRGFPSSPSSEAQVKLLEEVLKRFPTSALADHVYYSLAAYYPEFTTAEAYKASARKSYDLYAAVSPRHPRLRLRATLQRAQLVGTWLVEVPQSHLDAMLQELERDPAMIDTLAAVERPGWIAHCLDGVKREAARGRGDVLALLRQSIDKPDPRSGSLGAFALALADIETKGQAALPSLREILNDKDQRVRILAGYALARLAPEEPLGLKVLIREAKAKGSPEQDMAVRAMCCLGPIPKDIVVVLAEILQESDTKLRKNAVRGLGNVTPGTPAAQAAIPILLEALKDPDKSVRGCTVDSLLHLGQRETAMPTLIALLKDKEEGVRRGAAYTLVVMMGEARPAMPALIQALKDESADVRNSAANALRHLGAEAKEAIPALTPLLEDPDPEVRIAAAEALQEIRGEK